MAESAHQRRYRKTGSKKVVMKFSKQDVIDLILKMLKFNQREQALETYKRETALHPDWKLGQAVKAALQ